MISSSKLILHFTLRYSITVASV